MEELRLTKELHELNIDPEFRDLIPPLTEEERQMLEDSIIANGCESPLTVWNDTIVDGHNRYDICRKHGIPFAVLEKDFADRDAALMWMVQTQLGRRNLTAYQKGELALRFEKVFQAQAAERQEDSRFGADKTAVLNLAPPLVTGKTRDLLSKYAGISHGTMDKVKKLATIADDETKQKLRRGEVSVSGAYTDLMRKEHAGETKTCERRQQEKSMTDINSTSNRQGISALCKQCEAEVDAAAKTATEVASKTTEAVATEPVSAPPKKTLAAPHDARAMFSTVGDIADSPENFPNDIGLFEQYVNSFVCGVQYSLHQYKSSMINPENNARLRALIAKSQEALVSFDAFVAQSKTKENGRKHVDVRPTPSNVSGTDTKPYGNYSTLGELRDVPENFTKVVELFRRTLDSCYNGIDINLRQYKPTMVNDEHTAYLRGMIDDAFENMLAIFDSFVNNTYGDSANA